MTGRRYFDHTGLKSHPYREALAKPIKTTKPLTSPARTLVPFPEYTIPQGVKHVSVLVYRNAGDDDETPKPIEQHYDNFDMFDDNMEKLTGMIHVKLHDGYRAEVNMDDGSLTLFDTTIGDQRLLVSRDAYNSVICLMAKIMHGY